MSLDKIFGGRPRAQPIITPAAEPTPDTGIDPTEEERRRRRAAFEGIATSPAGVDITQQATGRSRLLGV